MGTFFFGDVKIVLEKSDVFAFHNHNFMNSLTFPIIQKSDEEIYILSYPNFTINIRKIGGYDFFGVVNKLWNVVAQVFQSRFLMQFTIFKPLIFSSQILGDIESVRFHLFGDLKIVFQKSGTRSIIYTLWTLQIE